MKKIIVFGIVMLTGLMMFSQGFSLNDTTIVFKDKAGNVLSKEQVMILMQNKFSMSSQDLPAGKKSVTILALTDTDMDQSKKEKEVLINNLLGKQLPGFSFNDIKGNIINADSLTGKVVVLNFWFTRCKPCIMEMPSLNNLVAKYKNEPVVFIAPSFDNKKMIQDFLNKRQFDYSVVAEAKDYLVSMGISTFPTHIVVNKQGYIVKVIIGFSEDVTTELEQTINKIK